MRKYLRISLCWILSFMNPIILDAYFHELKEDIRKMTQNYNTDAMEVIRNSRNIKKEVVQFHKIELGLSNENPVSFYVFICRPLALYFMLLEMVYFLFK